MRHLTPSSRFLITTGVKFGAHYLAYPGDPHMYHAQFTVRVVAPEDALTPADLAAASRAAAGARKLLLMATPREDAAGEWSVDYVSATPTALSLTK